MHKVHYRTWKGFKVSWDLLVYMRLVLLYINERTTNKMLTFVQKSSMPTADSLSFSLRTGNGIRTQYSRLEWVSQSTRRSYHPQSKVINELFHELLLYTGFNYPLVRLTPKATWAILERQRPSWWAVFKFSFFSNQIFFLVLARLWVVLRHFLTPLMRSNLGEG